MAFESTTPVPSLVAKAHGLVLDLGPGAGTQLDRFDVARVAHVYGVEPNTSFAPAFTARLQESALGLNGKYTLVSCGVEDGETLARFGVVENSVDCVVSMQVLVSFPPFWFPSFCERGRIGSLFGNVRSLGSALSHTRRNRPGIFIGFSSPAVSSFSGSIVGIRML